MRKNLCQDNNDTSHFWMEMSDVERYFTNINLCKIVNSSKFSNQLYEHKDGQKYTHLKFKMPTAGLFTLSASQIDNCRFTDDKGYKYSQVRMILAKVVDENKELNADNLRYVQGVSTFSSRDTYIEERLLRECTYVLIIEIEWNE